MAKKQTKASDVSSASDVTVTGTVDGKIRDVEVGLITGDVTQTNISGQTSSGGSGTTTQSTQQSNDVVAAGSASLGIDVSGSLKGQIRDVEVGLITGDVTQTNISGQAALGQGGAAITQDAVQANLVAALGHVDVDMVVAGSFKGQIRDIEVGLITADVIQTNISGQAVVNLAGPGGAAEIQQATKQANVLVAIGDIHLTIVFDGDFKGQVRDVSIGLTSGNISQTNTALEVALNVAGGKSKDGESVADFITQTNAIDASGGLDVTLVIDGRFKGDFRDVDIGLVVDNVVQSNTAVILHGADPVWG